MTTSKRPWATWKMTITFVVVLFILVVMVALIAFPGRHNEDRKDINHAFGVALIPLTVAVAVGQFYRVRRWDNAHRATQLGEPVLSTTTARCVVDDRPQPGRLELTATRIVFYRASTSDGVWGQLVGAFASERGREISLAIPLAAIASTARAQFRTTRNALEVTLTDGTVHRFVLDRYAPFEEQLRRARAAAVAPT